MPQIGFRQPRRRAARREMRDQIVDDLALPAAEAERLALALLLEQEVRLQILPRCVVGQVCKPRE